MVLLCLPLLWGCNKNSGSLGEANFDNDASYSLGYNLASDWKQSGVIPDYAELIKGIKAAYGDEEPRFPPDDMRTKVNDAYNAVQEAVTEAKKQAEIDFLAENSKKEGIIITESGLQYEVLDEGRGDKPGPEDTLRVNYEVSLSDGVIFDSTYEKGEPEEFPVSGVFPGLQEALQLMSEGASYRFFIPSDIAYGSWGSPPRVPAYATLIFKVDAISIVR